METLWTRLTKDDILDFRKPNVKLMLVSRYSAAEGRRWAERRLRLIIMWWRTWRKPMSQLPTLKTLNNEAS
jgi:hypothetical protein